MEGTFKGMRGRFVLLLIIRILGWEIILGWHNGALIEGCFLYVGCCLFFHCSKLAGYSLNISKEIMGASARNKSTLPWDWN